MHPRMKQIYSWSLTVGVAPGVVSSLVEDLIDAVDLSESASSAEASRNYWESYIANGSSHCTTLDIPGVLAPRILRTALVLLLKQQIKGNRTRKNAGNSDKVSRAYGRPAARGEMKQIRHFQHLQK